MNNDENFIKTLIKVQQNMDYADLNVGPAKGAYAGILPKLVELVQGNSELGISLDTTNTDEMHKALSLCKHPEDVFLNSTSKDEPRLEKVTSMAADNGSNIIALTLSKETGIPKTCNGRLEIAFEIYEKCAEKGIENEKIYFDPLILPVSIDQTQAFEALNTIKMIKESFDPPVKTIIGLSNISNGSPAELRPLINRTFAVLAHGAGLDAAIVDAKDIELVRILRMLETSKPEKLVDELYLNLSKMISDFTELEDVAYNKDDREQTEIIKAAYILTGKKIYSHSFTQI